MKKQYQPPKVTNIPEKINQDAPHAIYAAALMVGRALTKAMKGGIDVSAGADSPHTLQERHR